MHGGINIKHSFNLNVYHFTCTSSRGKEWYKNYGFDSTSIEKTDTNTKNKTDTHSQ